MKYAGLLILLLLLPLFSIGQSAVFSTDKTSVLYKGWKNEFSIAIPGYPCGDLRLQSTNCSIMGEGCKYIVIPYTTGLAVFTIRLKGHNNITDTIRVPVRQLPDPMVKIGSGMSGGGPIIKDGPVVVGDDCSFLEDFFQIIEFEISIYRGDTLIYLGKNTGRHYGPMAILAIENALPNDKLYMDNIRVLGPDSRVRTLTNRIYIFHQASKNKFNH